MSKSNKKFIKLGLPKRSLNNIERGNNTYQLLKNAGYDIRGYLPTKEDEFELSIKNDAEIIPFLIRPQNAAIELKMGFLDVVIGSEDWVQEFSAYNFGVKKIGDLKYAQGNIVMAISKKIPCSSLDKLLLSFFNLKNRLFCLQNISI